MKPIFVSWDQKIFFFVLDANCVKIIIFQYLPITDYVSLHLSRYSQFCSCEHKHVRTRSQLKVQLFFCPHRLIGKVCTYVWQEFFLSNLTLPRTHTTHEFPQHMKSPLRTQHQEVLPHPSPPKGAQGWEDAPSRKYLPLPPKHCILQQPVYFGKEGL